MRRQLPYLVRFGRMDGTASKTLPIRSKAKALRTANALSFVFWSRHDFVASACATLRRVDNEIHFVELIPPDDERNLIAKREMEADHV